jgi:chemotaxis protein histidine kinase CheA
MDQDTLSDFYLEADELIKQAEDSVLALEKSENYEENFSSVFRAFHSLKGAAGMLELRRLQQHMHFLEDLLAKKKNDTSVSEELVDYLLKAIDASKIILTDGDAKFSYYDPDIQKPQGPEHTQQNLVSQDSEIESLEENSSEASEEVSEKASEEVSEKVSEEGPIHLKLEDNSNLRSLTQPEIDECVGHIFIVDDEKDILTISKILLEDHNFKVSTFLDPEDAIKALSFVSPDVIVTDISMPKMNGIDFMKQVNKLKPHLPIIVFSGYVTKDVCLDALASGVTGILEKPIDHNKFLSQVQTACDRYQAFKLMMNGLDLLVYQFDDFDKYLQDLGHESKRQMIRTELKKLLKQKQILIKRAG